MIGIGGAIGTGLFLGAGGRLASAGPALVFVYAFCGVFAFFILRALGELVLHRPNSGSFVSYAREFFGEKAANVAGWVYSVSWALTAIVDITAVATYFHYWPALTSAMRRAITDRDYATIKRLWNELVPLLDDMSFSHYLATSKAFSALPFEYREAFGLVGFGTGGWDTNFPDSMLEILRVVYGGAEDDQQRILCGAQRLPQLLWQHAPEQLAHWPAGTSLASLHGGSPRGAVRRIRRPGGPGATIEVTDRWGRTATYPAVVATCQSWLLSARIDTDESLYSHPLWTAIERTHYMQSSKTFVVVDRPFWKDIDPDTGRHVLSTTLTDRLTRGTYLLDDGPDKPALICLSYTWNDDALKWLPLSVDERVRLMLHSLEQIYPNVDIASHIIGDPVTISWEDDPDFMGAFSDNLPGHHRYQERLYTHFMQDRFDPAHRGIFLAGDDVSWTGGWAEGTVTTGLNAVWGVMTQLGGKTSAANPGPGDRFDELKPVRLA